MEGVTGVCITDSVLTSIYIWKLILVQCEGNLSQIWKLTKFFGVAKDYANSYTTLVKHLSKIRKREVVTTHNILLNSRSYTMSVVYLYIVRFAVSLFARNVLVIELKKVVHSVHESIYVDF